MEVDTLAPCRVHSYLGYCVETHCVHFLDSILNWNKPKPALYLCHCHPLLLSSFSLISLLQVSREREREIVGLTTKEVENNFCTHFYFLNS